MTPRRVTMSLILAGLLGCAPSAPTGTVEPALGSSASGSTDAVAADGTAAWAADPFGDARHGLGHVAPAPWERGGGLHLATVMTRNLYLGADINKVLAGPQIPGLPGDVALAVTLDALWETVQATDFASRARALAAEIAAVRPDAVAVQEASLFRTGPGLACAGQAVPATEVAQDFLAMLVAELAARGHPYQVASVAESFDGTFCALKLDPATGQVLRALDLRYTDRDAVLVRRGLPTRDPQHGNFATKVELPVPTVPGLVITIPRGWASVAVKARGEWLRVVSTHLEQEAGPLGLVQTAQAAELVALVKDERLPLVVTGDFNAFAGSDLTGTYALLKGAGFHDAWAMLRPGDPGPTCCFAEDLRSGALTTRIDLVWLRGPMLPFAAARTGVTALTPDGLHHSDHAGVAARLLVLDPRCLHQGPGKGHGHEGKSD